MQCSKCHSTNNWNNINVRGHTFPMDHGDASGVCSKCHNGTKVNVDCYKCHDKTSTIEKHNEEGITGINGRGLKGMKELITVLGRFGAGETVLLNVIRRGTSLDVRVTLSEMP